MHCVIDGYSLRVLWLQVARSNNAPDNISSYYLTAVYAAAGCPVELITDWALKTACQPLHMPIL